MERKYLRTYCIILSWKKCRGGVNTSWVWGDSAAVHLLDMRTSKKYLRVHATVQRENVAPRQRAKVPAATKGSAASVKDLYKLGLTSFSDA